MFDLTFYRNKKILVTGHTGFKGSWLCRVLKQLGASVYGYSQEPPTNPSLYEIAKINKIVKSEIGDIADFNHLFEYYNKVKPELVFHLAAQPIVKESYIHPLETYRTNVMGTVNLLECLRLTDYTRSFLNVTTDKVYDNTEADKYYIESDPLDGFDPYSNSKSCSELVTHSYKRSFFDNSKCRISTARAGNVIGGGDFAKDRIIPDCVRAVANKTEIIVRNPNSIRPYQHVLEPIAAYLTIVARQYYDSTKEGSYNVGPLKEDCVNTGELVSLFCKHWSDSVNWVSTSDSGPHEANYLKLDSSRIETALGYKPRWHIDEAMLKTVEWTKTWLSKSNVIKIMDKQITEYFEGYY